MISKIGFVVFACMAFSVIGAQETKPASTAPTDAGPREKKVLLIGIDGLHLGSLHAQVTPHLDALFATVAYAGGVAGSSSEQSTFSGPGWSTILTGGGEHGVRLVTQSYDLVFLQLNRCSEL